MEGLAASFVSPFTIMHRGSPGRTGCSFHMMQKSLVIYNMRLMGLKELQNEQRREF